MSRGKGLLPGDAEVRVALVVLQPDVEGGLALPDERGFEEQRVDLGVDGDVLDRLRPPGENHLPRTERLRILEVRAHPGIQPLGLPNVEEQPVPVAEQVDPGLSGESGNRLLQVRRR